MYQACICFALQMVQEVGGLYDGQYVAKLCIQFALYCILAVVLYLSILPIFLRIASRALEQPYAITLLHRQ